jgi:hypothetical protein
MSRNSSRAPGGTHTAVVFAAKEERLQTLIWRSQPPCSAGKSVHYKLLPFNGQAIGQVSQRIVTHGILLAKELALSISLWPRKATAVHLTARASTAVTSA